MSYFIWKTVQLQIFGFVFNRSNGEMLKNESDWDNISILQQYQILLADTWEMKQMHCPFMLQRSINSCIQVTAQPASKGISNSNKEEGQILPPATLLQKIRRTRLFRQFQCWRGPTAQDAIQARAQLGAVGKVNTWASPSPLTLELDVCKGFWPWWFHSQNWLHVTALAFCLDSRKSVYRRLNTMKKWKILE